MFEVTKRSVFAESTDLGIWAISSLVEMKRKLETLSKHNSVQGIPFYERPVSSGRTYANVRDLEMDRADEKQGFREIQPAISASRPFRPWLR